jgi:1-deoxy-D-xylulose-5-phosphate synthase
MVLCLDRAGFSATDGATHHGLFDVSFLYGIPNVSVFAPENFSELKKYLKQCENMDGFCAIRYPKGGEGCFPLEATEHENFKYMDNGIFETPADCVIVTYGKISGVAYKAAKEIEGKSIRVICVTKLKPLSVDELIDYIGSPKLLYLPEEGIKSGGFAMHLTSLIREKKILENTRIVVNAIDDEFVPHGSNSDVYKHCGLDAQSIKNDILANI